MFHYCTRKLRQLINQIVYEFEIINILFQIREYVSVAIIFRSNWKIRALSILLYYIHQRLRLMHNRKQQKNHSKNCFFYYRQWHILYHVFEYVSRNHRIDKLKNYCIIQHKNFSFVDDHSWCIENFEKNEIFYWTIISSKKIFCVNYNFFLMKITRKIHNFSVDMIWNSFEHEMFASIVKNFPKNLWFHYDLTFALLRIQMTWKNIIIVIFAFDRLELIETFAEIVAKCQIDDCFEISMILWSE